MLQRAKNVWQFADRLLYFNEVQGKKKENNGNRVFLFFFFRKKGHGDDRQTDELFLRSATVPSFPQLHFLMSPERRRQLVVNNSNFHRCNTSPFVSFFPFFFLDFVFVFCFFSWKRENELDFHRVTSQAF
jgi:hypothetical protein